MAEQQKTIARNKKARFRFQFFEKYEAGLALQGTEVKSLRNGKASIEESFARPKGNELYLYNLHIPPYEQGNIHNHEPTRPRKLLLHRRELSKIVGRVQERGLTLVPTKLYFRNGYAKVEIALARGKRTVDKRQDLKKREAEREMARAAKARR